MKKIIIFFILVILISPIVQAGMFDFLTGKATGDLKYSSISEALQNFVDNYNERDDIYLVHGYYSGEADRVYQIPEIFANKVFFTDPTDKLEHSLLPEFIYDSSAPAYTKKGYPTPRLIDPSAQNIIVLGGPCANPLTDDLLDMECSEWPYKPGQAIIKLVNNGAYSAIIVAGTTRGDTARLAEEIKNYKTSSKLKSGTEVVFGTAIEVGGCGNGICETTEDDENCPSDCIDNSIQITFDTSSQVVLELYEDYVVWQEPITKFFIYNINTKQTQNFIRGQYPSIYENNLVYYGKEATKDLRGNPTELPALHLYNIQTKDDKVIIHAIPRVDYGPPIIYENKVFFQKLDQTYESREKPWYIYSYDISTGKTTELFDTGRRQVVLHVYDNKIYYMDDELNNLRYILKEYNVAQDKITKFETITEPSGEFDIYENIVVYSNRKTGDSEIYYYDLNTNREVRVTDQLARQNAPSIYGSYITWTDARNEIEELGIFNDDIYMCDITKNGQNGGCLTNDKKTRITVNAESQGGSKIYEKRIVWTDYRNSQGPTGQMICEGEGDRRICTNIGQENIDVYMYEF